jgi:DNA modification methylase
MGRQEAVSTARSNSALLEPVKKLSVGKNSQNTVIEGDSLQALASLKSRHAGEVDVIYIDSPYNLGKDDFRYSDKRSYDPDAMTAMPFMSLTKMQTDTRSG